MVHLIPIVTLMLLFTPLAAAAQAATPTIAAPRRPAGSPESDPFYLLPSPLPTRRARGTDPVGADARPGQDCGRGASSTTRRLWMAAMSPSPG